MTEQAPLQSVIDRLDAIIEQAKSEQAAYGYFAALYRSMTLEVQKGIVTGFFDDNERMTRLDIAFANRYFSAFDAWRQGGQPPASWLAAFAASKNDQYLVLQHLILGVNAHINFDLGIAAAEIASGQEIFGMKDDFKRINDIIAALTDQVQQKLSGIWPGFSAFDEILRTTDEGFINFSIHMARKAAWEVAQQLAFMNGELHEVYVEKLDAGVAYFSNRITTSPGLIFEIALPIIRKLEEGTVSEKMDILIR